jgi:phage shock protein PspC (stress-responsive transcriptional regulator)
MFCDGCGSAVQAGQAFCSKCGKQIVGPVSLMQVRPGRVQRHLRLLSILWMAFGAFNTIAGIILYVLANTVLLHMHEMGAPAAPAAFLSPFLSVIAILLLAKAACAFVAGWSLSKRESWGRTVALVLAFISLFTNIPFGTALGVYTLWVLLPAESDREYEVLAGSRAA